METINILLALYNPGNELDAQIASILEQTSGEWSLIVRDDGPNDKANSCISALHERFPEIVKIICDSQGNLGASRNFSNMLNSSISDYVMFCDQDDVWLPDKVQTSLKKMKDLEFKFGKQMPLLVHTDSKVVDDELNIISESFWKHQNIHPENRESLNRLLVQNVVTGCTIMINKPLRDLALPIPEDAVMHDWWLALVAAAFGIIGHVDQPTMMYRQHDANEIGAKLWSPVFVLKNVLGNDGNVRAGILKAQKQACAFLEKYHDLLPEDKRRVVECYAHINQLPYLTKVCMLIKYRLFKAGIIRNLGLWAHI